MRPTTTTIPGLTFDLLVEEINHRDNSGGLLCYMARVYKRDKATGAMQLLRRSRLPGSAAELKKEYQRDGIQAFRRLERA